MLLWTIMPEDIVLEGVEKTRTFRQVEYQNKNLIIEMGENGKGKVAQILSTDPSDFLDPDLIPGKEISIN
ncbi:MAG: YlzJ-like family protein [Desulfitobacteriaceae bacterium]|nr:YlzJ-like family protein [Desulfitobacteriaceae bacterium]MDD4751793.1 YlzJ-like family protein [Desulfitobacteriaceae bacterium]